MTLYCSQYRSWIGLCIPSVLFTISVISVIWYTKCNWSQNTISVTMYTYEYNIDHKCNVVDHCWHYIFYILCTILAISVMVNQWTFRQLMWHCISTLLFTIWVMYLTLYFQCIVLILAHSCDIIYSLLQTI